MLHRLHENKDGTKLLCKVKVRVPDTTEINCSLKRSLENGCITESIVAGVDAKNVSAQQSTNNILVQQVTRPKESNVTEGRGDRGVHLGGVSRRGKDVTRLKGVVDPAAVRTASDEQVSRLNANVYCLEHIFSFLEIQERMRAALVCTRWAGVARIPVLVSFDSFFFTCDIFL